MEKLPTIEKEQKEKFRSQSEVVKDKDGQVIDIIVGEGNAAVSLRNFIPEGVKLDSESKIFEFAIKKDGVPYIRFNASELDSFRGRLALLHEIGHAIDFKKHPEIQGELTGTLRDTQKKISDIRFDILIKEPIEVRADSGKHEVYILENLSKELKNSGISEEKLSRFIKILARDERMAWAEALRLYRKIKKQKADILDESRHAEIVRVMEESLGSYEATYKNLVPEQQFKLFLVKKFGMQEDLPTKADN